MASLTPRLRLNGHFALCWKTPLNEVTRLPVHVVLPIFSQLFPCLLYRKNAQNTANPAKAAREIVPIAMPAEVPGLAFSWLLLLL